MGKKNGTASGAASGAAAGTSIMPGWGTAIGAVAGGIMGSQMGGEEAQQVQQVDPAFLESLRNQANGTEKTAADLKLKAAFDQSLAQQVAAARSARGVNPALLQRNVARVAAENNARGAQAAAEMNLASQADARSKYLQAIGLNMGAQKENASNQMAVDKTNNAQIGSLINSAGGIGATFATAAKTPDSNTSSDNAVKEINSNQYHLSEPTNSTQEAAAVNGAYSLGANTNVPMYATSDERVKTKIKKVSAPKDSMTVVSDERQKDLIKNESLPQNGNMAMQNQAAGAAPAMGAQTAPMAAFASPQAAAPVASAPMQQAPSAPAPVPASQTAMGQANASLAKGGSISDLQTQDTSGFVKPADGPSKEEILAMSMDAQRRQERDVWGNVTQSDSENYAANLARWNAGNQAAKAAYDKQMQDAATANQAVNSERSARLAKFYTGTSNVNANDLAQRYAPKTVLEQTDWQTAQNNQAALGIGDQSHNTGYFIDKHLSTYSPTYRATSTTDGAGAQVKGLLNDGRTVSDERAKTAIKSESNKASDDSMNPKSFLDKLTAYSYEYKQGQKANPNAGPGRHLSVMAQDLSKAGPVGASMVEETPEGVKQVNYGKGFGAILAAQVQLNERLAKIEAKKGK